MSITGGHWGSLGITAMWKVASLVMLAASTVTSEVGPSSLSFKQLNTDGDGCCECATDRHLPAACLPLRLPRCRCRGAGRSGELCAVLEQHRF